MQPSRLVACAVVLACAFPAQASETVPSEKASIQLSFAPVVRQTAPAVVNIFATKVVAERISPFAGDPFFSQFFGGFAQTVPRIKNSLGSGVILSENGIVISNHHVVGDASEIRVVLSDRREFDGEILLSDEEADIAVIQLEDADGLPALELGESDAVEVGDLVLAIGNPFGIGQTVTSGIVSGLARSGGHIGNRSGYYIQTDAPINPGNSGGALVDVEGRLIGINTSILTRSGGSNGIGFAIPSNLVREYIKQAREGRTEFVRPWSGMLIQEIDSALSEALGQPIPSGVLITEMHKQSTFRTAGLMPGDVILSIDSLPVNAASELEFRLATKGPGTNVEIAYQRNGAAGIAVVSLLAAPDEPKSLPVRVEGPSLFERLVVANVNPRLIDQLDLPLDTRGVIVVSPEGYAGRVGLRAGDVLVRLNGELIETADQFAMLASTAARTWELDVQRAGRTIRMRIGG